MSNTKEPIKITKTDLIEKINAGWKKPELAAHYGIPVLRIGQIVSQAGLRFRSFKGETAIFIDDTVDNNTTVEQETLKVEPSDFESSAAHTEAVVLEEAKPETKIVEEGLF